MSYAHYRECPAKSGQGKRRTELLAALKMEESMRDHWIIRTVALRGTQVDVPKEDLDGRKACEAEIARLSAELEDITRPPKVKPLDEDYLVAAAEAGLEWESFGTAKKNRLATAQRYHREYHALASAIMRTG